MAVKALAVYWKGTTMQQKGIWYKLPPHFIRDSLECGCDVGEWSGAFLKATPEQLHELRSRALYYVDPWGPDAVGDGGVLKRSARALLKKMEGLSI